jgi:hypothetical protein
MEHGSAPGDFDPTWIDDLSVELLRISQQPSQDTIRTLCDYVQGVADAGSPDETGDASTSTLYPVDASVLELVARKSNIPCPSEPQSNLRHVATLTTQELCEDGIVTRSREIWWGSDGDYFELRGDPCDEAEAHQLIQSMWPTIE